MICEKNSWEHKKKWKMYLQFPRRKWRMQHCEWRAQCIATSLRATYLCMCVGRSVRNQHDCLITLASLTWLIVLGAREWKRERERTKISIEHKNCEHKNPPGHVRHRATWNKKVEKPRELTRWSISNAYSNPDVKLATFSHFIALTASFISFTLSTLARTYDTQTNQSGGQGERENRITSINLH